MTLADLPLVPRAPRFRTVCGLASGLFAAAFLGTAIVAACTLISGLTGSGAYSSIGFMDGTVSAIVSHVGWAAFLLLGWLATTYLRQLAENTAFSQSR